MRPEYAERYSGYEASHWWFRARRAVLGTLFKKTIPWAEGMEVLEIGAGPGANLAVLYPECAVVYGLEPNAHNAELAAKASQRQVFQGSLEKMPAVLKSKRFDVITMLDVIEHIEHDMDALALLNRKLKPGGQLVLTVPAYQWLWGQQDAANIHYRRYNRKNLGEKLTHSGFAVQYATYFNTLLFPPIAVFRLLQKLLPRGEVVHSDFEYSAGPLDNLLYRTFATEAALLKHARFPFGLSLFMVARTPG